MYARTLPRSVDIIENLRVHGQIKIENSSYKGIHVNTKKQEFEMWGNREIGHWKCTFEFQWIIWM